MGYPGETPGWRRYFRFWRRDVRSAVDDEIRFHFAARIEELTAAGHTPEEARAKALEEFGDVRAVCETLEEIDTRMVRRAGRIERLDAWRRDLVYAWRSLRRTPALTLTIVATLALGLGANAAMFSLLNAVFLKPPTGVSHPEQLRRLWTTHAFANAGRQFWPGYDYQQYLAARKAIAGLGTTATYDPNSDARWGGPTSTTKVAMSHASADFFSLLGVHPALGHFYTADADRPGAAATVAVASYAFWKRALGADSAALGRTIELNGTSYTLIGVAQPGFSGVELSATDLWTPLAALQADIIGKTQWWTSPFINAFQILIRLRPGTSDAAVEARATPAVQRPGPEYTPDSTATTRTGSIIAARGPGPSTHEIAIATRLGGVALIVLLIACANVVNLLLARAVRRRQETAVRLALGMSRGRLARMVLTESVLLALLAGVAAILAAEWGGLALRGLLMPSVHWAHGPVDSRVLAAALTATVLAGLAAGAVPALQSGGTELTEAIKAGAREGFVRRSRTRSALVIAQTALSVTLLVGAALFVRSLVNVRAIDLGFDARGLLYARIGFDTSNPARDSLTPGRLAEVAERLRSVPGVERTALTTLGPMQGFMGVSYFPEADTLAYPKPEGMFWGISPGYLATEGTRFVAGRDFASGSTAGAVPAVIINTAMAKALWPNENPLGRCIHFKQSDAECSIVIGIVETARWGGLIEDPTPQFYLPLAHMPFALPSFHVEEVAVRARDAMMPSVIRSVHAALLDAFPGGWPVIHRMSTVLAPKYRPWRLGATLFTLFGVLAALVAAIGVYSTVSYGVSLRTHEFGVRMALGARVGDVIRQVMAQGLRVVALGVLVGIGLALAGGRLVASLLYGVSPHDPLAIGAVAGLLLLVAGAATLVPAGRAARVDPARTLRAE